MQSLAGMLKDCIGHKLNLIARTITRDMVPHGAAAAAPKAPCALTGRKSGCPNVP
jgi:hypothetical protein